jgi:tetracycline 7-halogenase / FADH2 O2-dependent halogenase
MDYDIVVLGSGIAGSMTAMVLRRIGLRTLVVERKSHPRFVIGESTLPTTSLLLNSLANTYDIPELAQVAHYLTLREHHCAAWPKQHFWYGVHDDNARLEPHHESLLEALPLPMGPDVHMLRADVDGFLASRLEAYGADYLENTELLDFATEAGGVRVRIRTPEGERDVHARFVVDASGHASFFGKRFGIRDDEAQLQTNTRSIFAHFKGVRDLDDALGGRHPAFRFRRRAGTMHHCFRGGWIWVIPFDNDVTSVGFQLDRRIYPLDESITPEEEVTRILDRYPSVKAHLGEMIAVRPLIRADRIQFTCKTILGEGFILTPHAAAFVEPLFSTGILLTLAFISRFAKAARAAAAADDWNIERFRPVERLFFAEVRHIDHIVDGMIQSFRSYDVFKQYWRFWIVGTMAQWCTGVLASGATRETPMLYGSAFPGFVEEVETAHALVCRTDIEPMRLAAMLKERVDPWWERVCMLLMGVVGGDFSLASAGACSVYGPGKNETMMAALRRFAQELGPLDASIDVRNAEAWMARAESAMSEQHEHYERSRREGTDFHRAYERILDQQNPATFDYYERVGLAKPARDPDASEVAGRQQRV